MDDTPFPATFPQSHDPGFAYDGLTFTGDKTSPVEENYFRLAGRKKSSISLRETVSKF